ncbi:hypothetical protein AAFC00_006767 [Neodothiora populina]|uniref:Pre-mRNA-splicing factor CWC26 n=1 Tax=Neodothiora populina TaxID=2781224 RepID=A0ABR3PCB2_9PEZI
MGLADYLAKNYLSADKPSKKRKRKQAEAGLIIADEDENVNTWKNSRTGDDDEDGPLVVPGGVNISKRTTTWKTVGSAAPSHSEQAAADAILADAAAEDRARGEDEDEAPTMVDEDGPMMANGAMAGLQTADQVSAALKRREREERKKMKEAGLDPTGKSQETIYRDASGRIINVAMKRAELRRQAEEEERKKAEELENRKGDVQRREKEARQKELANAKGLGVARYADDKGLNNELKERERWNDPALQFLSTKSGGKGGKSTKGKKTYVGAFEPNRYGIRPGYRWDGVDRSIGFEKKWFEARNNQQNIKDLKYAWQMDE